MIVVPAIEWTHHDTDARVTAFDRRTSDTTIEATLHGECNGDGNFCIFAGAVLYPNDVSVRCEE